MHAAFGGLGGGFGDFGFGVRTLIEEDPGAGAKGGGEETDGACEGRDGTGGDDGGAMGLEPVLGAVGTDFDVGEAEGSGGGCDEARLFLRGLEKGEAGFGQDECERNSGEARAAAGIDDVSSAGEQAPRHDGIGDVLDGGLAGADDAGEVEMLIGFDNEIEVPGGAGDHFIAMGQVGWEDLLELFGKGHGAFMIALGGYSNDSTFTISAIWVRRMGAWSTAVCQTRGQRMPKYWWTNMFRRPTMSGHGTAL